MTPIRRSARKQVVANRSPRRRGRPRRDFGAMEARRMQAMDLFEQEVIPAEIARAGGCLASDRLGLAQGVAPGWPRRAALGWASGSKTEAECRSVGAARRCTDARRRGQWLPHRRMDLGAGGQRDRAGKRGALPPWARVV